MAGKKPGVNGRRIPHTPITVDYFQRGTLPPRTLFFLTHAHADHLYGLDSSFNQKIYCTSVTKKLLLQMISLEPELIEEIEYDSPFQIHLDCPEQAVICVTAINAHHCPGSAMFLFEGYFGKILYTGDFRLDPDMFTHLLLVNSEPDILFLDNTYNNPMCRFPTREITRNIIVQKIRSAPDLRTFIALNRIGKEDLLLFIAEHTNVKIGVSEEQYQKMCILGLGDICSLETDLCQITVVPFHAVTATNVKRWVSEMPTQVIVPTARFKGRDSNLPEHPSVIVVPHSDHSSFQELQEFVELVKPVSIQPIVQRRDICDLSSFNCYLSNRPPIHFEVPTGVQQMISSKTFFSSPINNKSNRYKPVASVMRVPKGVHYTSISPKKSISDDGSSGQQEPKDSIYSSRLEDEMTHKVSHDKENERKITSYSKKQRRKESNKKKQRFMDEYQIQQTSTDQHTEQVIDFEKEFEKVVELFVDDLKKCESGHLLEQNLSDIKNFCEEYENAHHFIVQEMKLHHQQESLVT